VYVVRRGRGGGVILGELGGNQPLP
jgi:hypothetical protein